MTESAVTQEMKDAIRVESDPVVNDIEKGAIIKFAQAIGDENPIYNDEIAARDTNKVGIIAPPTFLRSMKVGPPKVNIKSPYSARVDGGSEWEYFELVRPGDTIAVTQYLVNVSERQGRLGNMLIMVTETKYVNQFGKTVALQRGTSISYDPPPSKNINNKSE